MRVDFGMKRGRPWALGLLISVGFVGCLEPNPDWRSPLDLCPGYPVGGGGGKGRPAVLLRMGMGSVARTGSFPIDSFSLDVFEVTVAAYRECVQDAGRCSAPRDQGADPSCNWTASPGLKENHPINCTNWQQANDFCTWAGRRLPTEAEWEFAAEGPIGAASTFPWGASAPQSGVGGQLCWSKQDGTCQVGQFGPTLQGRLSCDGMFDLAGSVWEWTQTKFEEPYQDPGQLCDFMTSTQCSLRGGSWADGAGKEDNFKAVFRVANTPKVVSSSIGFRCASDP